MYTSRLPQIAAGLGARMDVVAREVAREIEQGARERVPVDSGDLRDSIATTRVALGDYRVEAGAGGAFYGFLVEFGTSKTPARPFMVPAAEAVAPRVREIGAAALARLA